MFSVVENFEIPVSIRAFHRDKKGILDIIIESGYAPQGFSNRDVRSRLKFMAVLGDEFDPVRAPALEKRANFW